MFLFLAFVWISISPFVPLPAKAELDTTISSTKVIRIFHTAKQNARLIYSTFTSRKTACSELARLSSAENKQLDFRK